MSDALARLAAALEGRYRIERELGGGGMARVFVAREVALDRDVVVKVIAPELREGLSADRFAREVALAARLQQANIVPVLSAGDAEGMPYYTMPYVDGQSLRVRLERGPLPLGEALDVLRDVARALAYAHAQGIVHRDIKPENVLLSSGTAVVTDFGIAKAISAARRGADRPERAEGARDLSNAAENRGDRPEAARHLTTLTQVGTSLGTPAYMAPEQALGDVVDARTDLYAWGVIAYELLAGAHPFAAHTTAQRLVAAHLGEAPAPLAAARPEVPRDVATLVMQCLAKDPAERPADASEVLARLSAAVTPGARRSAGAGARGMGRDARAWLGAAAVLALVLLVVAVVIARRASADTPARTVVVVPFDNLGDPSDAYFAAGVSDEIAGQLARLPGLQVIGREGVRRFSGSTRSPRDIARELGAAWVLSGTVRWARGAKSGVVDGDARVRIVPALVNVATGVQAWGEPSDERLTDIFRVQASVAERVASALSVTLGGAARATLAHEESSDPEARDAQLLGRYLLRQRGLANLRRAEDAFERAIARDSGYARAWAGLSEAMVLRPQYLDTTESTDRLLARAEQAARRAAMLDSTLPDVQMALARSYTAQFRFNDAGRAIERVLAIDPNSTLGLLLAFQVRTALGRVDEAGEASRRAVALDALSSLALNTRAVWFSDVGAADSAVHYAERAVAVTPGEPLWERTLAIVYASAGRLGDGVRACRSGVGFAGRCDAVLAGVAGVTLKRGATLEALGALGRAPGVTGAPAFAAMVYARLGMPDSMFARLATAIEWRDDSFTYLITHRAFAPYHGDPRWDAIVGQVRRR